MSTLLLCCVFARILYGQNNCIPNNNNNAFCDNTCDTCILNCDGTSCKEDNFYSAALITNIRCHDQDSCLKGKFYIGDSKGPSNSNPKLFNRTNYSSVNIDCQTETSCKEIEINIIGNFVNGITINAKNKGLENANINVDIGEGQIFNINCESDGCVGTTVRCNGGICKCNDIEKKENGGCVNFLINTPNPTIGDIHTTSPTKITDQPSTITNSPTSSVAPSMEPSMTPTFYPTKSPTITVNTSAQTNQSTLFPTTNVTFPTNAPISINPKSFFTS